MDVDMRAKAKVVKSKSVQVYLDTNKRHKELNFDDLKIILLWIDAVESFGSEILQKATRVDEVIFREKAELALERAQVTNFELLVFRDHELSGDWSGHRSSSFSNGGRIIYRVDKGIVELVEITKITKKHNYRKV